MSRDAATPRIVVLGGTSGIGLATARVGAARGAEPILVGRDPQRLAAAAAETGATHTAAFDVTDERALAGFFDGIGPIDHVLVTTGGPHYAPFATMDFDRARTAFDARVATMLAVARHAAPRIRPGGAILFLAGTGTRRPAVGLAVTAAMNEAAQALVKGLAIELAPIRVNLIAAGFVDTPLSAALLGDRLDQRRDELRATLPIRRVVQPEDVAELALHLMANTAITGGTYDIDGGEQLL